MTKKTKCAFKGLIILLMILFSACAQSLSTQPQTMPEETATLEPSVTPTVTPTNTATPQLYDVSILAFWDYNGNGIQNSNEPSLEGITASIQGFQCTTSAVDISTNGNIIQANCRLGSLPDGKYELHVIAPENFKWILPSEWDKIQIQRGLTVELDGKPTMMSVPLSEGSWVFPAPEGYVYKIGTWFDRDPQKKAVSNWLGEHDSNPKVWGTDYFSKKIMVEDGHNGVDIIFSKASQPVPVLALDTGIVFSVLKDMEGNIVIIKTSDGIYLDYGHVTPTIKLEPGITKIARGQQFGVTNKHAMYDLGYHQMFHFGTYKDGCNMTNNISRCIDPFSPSRWTVSDYELTRNAKQ